MSVLKIKDENGNWIGITSIKGDEGDAGEGAYTSAVKGGYAGTEEELNAALAEVVQMQSDIATAQNDIGMLQGDAQVFAAHTSNTNNPHGVTPTQIGAVKNTGDTVNGNLDVNGAFAVKRSDSNRTARTVAHNNADKEVDFQNYGDDSNYVSVRVATETKGVGDAVKVTQMKNGAYSEFTMLHTGNKEKIFTHGTEDLTAGSSPLGTGQLHFVYE